MFGVSFGPLHSSIELGGREGRAGNPGERMKFRLRVFAAHAASKAPFLLEFWCFFPKAAACPKKP